MLAWLVSSWWQPLVLETDKHSKGLDMVQAGTDMLDISTFSDVALFGTIIKKTVVKKVIPKVKTVVASKLNVKLLATVVAGKRSAAVVMMNGAKQQVFFLGAEMLPSVVLKEVEIAAIVVNNHGRLERILLPKSKSIRGITIKEGKHDRVKILHRAELNRQINDFPKLLSQARVVPYFQQGKSAGFVIMEIVKGSLYQKIGLKDGDVIQKVNGTLIKNASQAMKMYQDLQHANAIDLELIRAGSMFSIHYEIK